MLVSGDVQLREIKEKEKAKYSAGRMQKKREEWDEMQSMVKRKQREKRDDKYFWKGSYTVEAAVILPLTALILAAVILAAFYIHDRSCMQGIACEIASSGSNCITQEQRTRRVAQLRQEVKLQRFLGSRNLSASVSSGKTEVNAKLDASYPIPGMVARFFTKGSLPVQCSWKTKDVEPAKTIWQIRGVASILGGET